MEFALVSQLEKRKKADVLAIPFWKGVSQAEEAAASNLLGRLLSPVLKSGDFTGKEGEIALLYIEGEPEQRIALIGLGPQDKVSTECLRKSYGALAKACLAKKIKSLNILVPLSDRLTEEEKMEGLAEGLLLPNYVYNRLKSTIPEEEETALIQKISLITSDKRALGLAEEAQAVCDGVDFARDLINGNADEITPQYLASCAQGLSQEYPSLKTTVFDKKRIEKEGLDLLLAVNRGSALDPAFIIMEYRGRPKSKDNTVIIGKGITYDTGGLNLKPTGGMETMKCDMAGAAACFGTMVAVCNLGLQVNLTVVIPTTENGIDAKSFKPGDVYRSYAGTTVEMMNSDAEGRLVLADALAYASQKLKPTRMIDIATLTGAIEVALGSEATGIMSNHDGLAEELVLAGERTFERLWRMPLYEEYKERLKSDIADIKSWNGRSASSNVAATFLKTFVGADIPWAHLDIAGTAYLSEGKKYNPKYATGVGVRLLTRFLKDLSIA
ncbi:MAG: leucyl aminopeptidase [Parachlamydia sp.]|jgi:leucyl aminopeptidase|nr:leucyl aminopeptidase [Parachlamydia sp.]